VNLLFASGEQWQSLRADTCGSEQSGTHYVLSPNRAAARFPGIHWSWVSGQELSSFLENMAEYKGYLWDWE